MPDNLFEKLDHIEKNQEQANQQGEENTQKILDAISQLGSDIKSSAQVVFSKPQNTKDNTIISLQNFIRRSSKVYHYFSDEETFNNDKLKTIISLALVLLIGFITNILTTVACGIFSTFTFIEDIWLFLVIRMLCHTIHSKRFYDHLDYADHSCNRFEMNGDGLYRPIELKTSYKIFKVLALISALCNIIYACMNAKGAITVWAVIFEILFFASVFFAIYMVNDVFCMYTIVYYSGRNEANTATVTIVHDMLGNKLYTKEDYENKFPFAR